MGNNNSQYKLTDEIVTGTFKCIHPTTHKICVLKRLLRTKNSDRKQLKQDYSLLTKLDHLNILQVLAVEEWYEDEDT